MGTNYYRIPPSKEVMERHQKLVDRISRLDWFDAAKLERNFAEIEDPKNQFTRLTPWDEFMYDIKVHLGKRSSGWKFCWNFHHGKYYSNRESLLKYIRSGRVVDEYGELQETEEFIKMALGWDGMVVDKKYLMENKITDRFASLDKEVDGLRVSPHDDFC
jgi:hypothetical protein